MRNFVTGGEGISYVVVAVRMADFGIYSFRLADPVGISKKSINKYNEIEKLFRARTQVARNLARGLQ